ncbi:MAG: hypothetical protein PSV35_09680, partial [bacterium]|nr:hypothetical protein [bacterium]
SLHKKSEFSELKHTTAYLVNHQLRAYAQMGATDLFYPSGQLNPIQFNELVILKPKLPNEGKANFLANLLLTTSSAEQQIALVSNIPQHDLVSVFSEKETAIKTLDYFLIHFKGDNIKLEQLIRDCLEYYCQQGFTESRRQLFYNVSTLMTRPELDFSVRESIYSTLLGYPELYDEQISYCLFLFDAKRTIQYFGLQGGEQNYQRVIELCTGALKKLNTNRHKDIIAIATRAKSEAELELSFDKDKGFFSRLFRRLKRCWICGWTGFFSPNLPIYVLPASSPPIIKKEKAHLTPSPAVVATTQKELVILLKEAQTNFTPSKLKELGHALKEFTLRTNPKNEESICLKVHHLLQLLGEKCKNHPSLKTWLTEHEAIFSANALRLMQFFLIKDDLQSLKSFVSERKTGLALLQQVANDLHTTLPEYVSSDMNATNPAQTKNPSLLQSATTFVNNQWTNLTNSFNFFPKSPAIVNVPGKIDETPTNS